MVVHTLRKLLIPVRKYNTLVLSHPVSPLKQRFFLHSKTFFCSSNTNDQKEEQYLDRASVFVRVKETLKRLPMKTGLDQSLNLSEKTLLSRDLDLDSLDRVEFCLLLEEEFKFSMADDMVESIETLGEAVDLIVKSNEAV